MSGDLKIVALEAGDKPPPLRIRALDSRYRCIIRIGQHVGTAVLSPDKLSPSREWIFLGDFWSDHFMRHWRKTDEIEIVEVLAKITDDGPPRPRPWWKRLLGIGRG